MKKLILILTIAFCSQTVNADQVEPLQLKFLKMNMSEKEFLSQANEHQVTSKKQTSKVCSEAKNKIEGDRECSITMTLAGKLANLHIYFYADKLGGVIANFSSNDFESIEQAFTQKFGKPTIKKDQQVTWTKNGSTVFLTTDNQYPVILFSSEEYDAEIDHRKASQASKASEDL